MIAVMAALSAAWVSLFVNDSPQDPFAARKAGFDNVFSVLKLSGIAPFGIPAYRLGLESLLAIAGLTCVAAMLKHGVRASSSAVALLTTSTICFALFCFMPLSINGSGYFANRFAIFWIMLFIAAAAGLHPPPHWSLAGWRNGLWGNLRVAAHAVGHRIENRSGDKTGARYPAGTVRIGRADHQRTSVR